MNPTKEARARKISDEEWIKHKKEIVDRYTVSELERPGGVIEWMIEHHNFKASKAQYEYKFRKWGIWKYEGAKRTTKRAAVTTIDHTAPNLTWSYGSSSEAHGENALILPLGSCSWSSMSCLTTVLPITCRSGEIVHFADDSGSTDLFNNNGAFSNPPANLEWNLEVVGAYPWMTKLDRTFMPDFNIHMKKLAEQRPNFAIACRALIPRANAFVRGSFGCDLQFSLGQYFMSLLLNNKQPPAGVTLDQIHRLFRSFGATVVKKCFRALDQNHADVLQERVFAAAIADDDKTAVLAILEMKPDLRQAIYIEGCGGSRGPQMPLCAAVIGERHDAARAIADLVCREYSTQDLETLLDQVLICYNGAYNVCAEIVRKFLNAGAIPTFRCFRFAQKDPELLQDLLKRCENTFMDHIRANLLQRCLEEDRWTSHDERLCSPLHRSVLEFLKRHAQLIPKNDPMVVAAFWKALDSAANIKCAWGTELILTTSDILSISLRHPNVDDETSEQFIEACRNYDWSLVEEIARAADPSGHSRPAHTYHTHPSKDDLSESLSDALRTCRRLPRQEQERQDHHASTAGGKRLLRRVQEEKLPKYELETCISTAIDQGCHELTLALSPKLEFVCFNIRSLLRLLYYSELSITSQIITRDTTLGCALRPGHHHRLFDKIDDLIYRQLPNHNWHQDSDHFTTKEQVTLRILAYHAIHVKDYELLDWLLQTGLYTGNVHVSSLGNFDEDFVLLEVQSSSFPPRPSSPNASPERRNLTTSVGYRFFLYSLLAVAAEHNDNTTVQFLLSRGITTGLSTALMAAVGARSSRIVLEMLLSRSYNAFNTRPRNFGAAALRAAVFTRQDKVLQFLSEKVDVNGVELLRIQDSRGKILDLNPMTPLGEAILRRNLQAAKVLIANRAEINGLVAFTNYENSSLMNKNGAILRRASPLLAAIDTENLDMVKLLVEARADVDYSPRQGLIRTPLQRAAEIGHLEIVQYLLEMGAAVDSVPCYSGGTPLQLASLGGHVEVAKLLLENNANLNRLPAEGEGRTALEAAAEWNRVDIMSELVSRGVNFSLIVDDKGHTQYQRALSFAQKRGMMASMRFLKRLANVAGYAAFDYTPESEDDQEDSDDER